MRGGYRGAEPQKVNPPSRGEGGPGALPGLRSPSAGGHPGSERGDGLWGHSPALPKLPHLAGAENRAPTLHHPPPKGHSRDPHRAQLSWGAPMGVPPVTLGREVTRPLPPPRSAALSRALGMDDGCRRARGTDQHPAALRGGRSTQGGQRTSPCRLQPLQGVQVPPGGKQGAPATQHGSGPSSHHPQPHMASDKLTPHPWDQAGNLTATKPHGDASPTPARGCAPEMPVRARQWHGRSAGARRPRQAGTDKPLHGHLSPSGRCPGPQRLAVRGHGVWRPPRWGKRWGERSGRRTVRSLQSSG